MNIVIVGGTSGIGMELWKNYINTGNTVAVLGRRSALLEKQKAQYPDNTRTYVADITQIDETHNTLKRICSDLGIVHLAIICAGIGDINKDLLLTNELNTINTNVCGWTAVVNFFCHKFQQQGEGHLVTITSVGGQMSEPAAPAYSATKAFQINYTRALRKKYKDTNITVTEIRPGLVDTAMAKGDGLFWVMPTAKVAEQIVYAITKKKSLAVVTKRWRIISFLLKHFF